MGIVSLNFDETGAHVIPQNLHRLTSVRFFAAAAVVLFHIFDDMAGMSQWLETLIRKGSLGVDLFFILSGFILTHVYLPQYHAAKFGYKSFLIKRFARVYPAHITMILVFLVVYVVAGTMGFTGNANGMNWGDLPYHLTMTHAWGMASGAAWNYPSWSISAEWFAYLLFPAYLAVATRMSPLMSLGVAFCGFVASFVALSFYELRLTGLAYNFGILRIFFEFMIGIAVYQVFQTRYLPPVQARAWFWACLVMLVFCGAADLSDVLIIPVFALLIYVLACLELQQSDQGRVSKTLVYLGEISYSTYMVHAIFLIIAQTLAERMGFAITDPLPLLVLLSAIYISSVLMYHMIEIPMRRWIQKIALGKG